MHNKHGFELVKEQEIPELNTLARLYRHTATDAELLSLENDDENKTFGITFRTPPTNSTGVAHILEHAVLCGSRKYPVKEPFVELLKSSLQTFLNALTFADKTCYPVASQNLQDFYNLIDVYLDAVFYPRITPEIFQQEGWHYEADSIDAPLTYKGVVYNEMKGAYSSPDTLIGLYSETSLFPDNAYGYSSGGEPEVIPELTYEQFRAFHQAYYHPSNARIFFCGNDDPEERLRLVQAYLKDFEPLHIENTVALQTPFEQARRVAYTYPAGDDVEGSRSMLTINWLLPPNDEPSLTLALQTLSYVLVGMPASPLRKALIDSGLGEEVIGAGLDDSLRQLYFSTGLKGVDPKNTDQVENLIVDTLTTIRDAGIDHDTVEAALNTIEFRLREQNFGSYPKGLVLMITALTTWLHDGDPCEPIAFERPLSDLKSSLSEDRRFLENLVDRYLLSNPHRVTVVLDPDPELQKQREAAESARLQDVRSVLTPAEIASIIEGARRLKELQEAPDSPEALATIPTLTLNDLDPETKHVPIDELSINEATVLYHDLFTNGIIYLDLGFNLHALPQDLLPYADIFGTALVELGTESEDFVRLTQRIGQTTGGIYPTTFIASTKEREQTAAWLLLRGKATVVHTQELLDILRDVLLTIHLDNQERFIQILLERKAGLEASLIPAGHRVVASRLRSKLDEAGWASEQISGIDHLLALRALIGQARSDWPAVLDRFERLRHALIDRRRMICNITIDESNWSEIQPLVEAFVADIPATGSLVGSWRPVYSAADEGLTIPAQVNYVAKGGNLFDEGYAPSGSSAVITHYLRSTWLWERVRVQGGAYGAFCSFDHHSGIFTYASYRDPNIVETIRNFDRAATFLNTLDVSSDELTRAIIGAIGNIDTYQLPDAKGFSSMRRFLVGYSDEERQRFRDEVLTTTVDDFRAFGCVLEAMNQRALAVVLGSQDAIERAQADGHHQFRLTRVL
ncbi:MAG: peptidase M16 [Chloroflexi bacterium]|nr:peptidase M16 [Chloroflexota bacterium]